MGETGFEEHRERFARDGFTIVRAAFPAAQMAAARALAGELVELAERNPSDVFTRHYLPHRPDQGVLYDLYQRFPEFAALARHEPLVDAIRAIWSRNFFLYENSLVYKPRHGDNAVPWHQDFMGRRGEPPKLIAWMALDDVDEANGCVYAVPGSHRDGFRPWVRVRGETHHTRAVTDGVDLASAVPVEMRAGDVLLFHCALLHSSREIRCEQPRRAYRAAYQSFESARVPRGSPIVISLEDRSELLRPYDYEPGRVKWFVHRIGRRLADW